MSRSLTDASTKPAASALKTYLPLLLAVAIGLIAALTRSQPSGSAPFKTSASAASLEPLTAELPSTLEAAEKRAISGRVLERIDVERYTYLRLTETGAGSEALWTAVSSTAVRVGDRVTVRDAERMTDFVSATLKRTFGVIYFGVLADSNSLAIAEPSSARDNPDGHANSTGISSAASAHGHQSPSAASVKLGSVTKAQGPLGRTVAETHARSSALQGKRVRVRGIVVKSIAGVLGRTFVHVQDGTGSSKTADQDLTVTTTSQPNVGEEILFEGTLSTHRDFGAGYTYPVLLEHSEIVSE